eukprot:scpid103115/ scgid25347/ 
MLVIGGVVNVGDDMVSDEDCHSKHPGVLARVGMVSCTVLLKSKPPVLHQYVAQVVSRRSHFSLCTAMHQCSSKLTGTMRRHVWPLCYYLYRGGWQYLTGMMITG